MNGNLLFGCYKMDRCPQVVYWKVLVENCSEVVQAEVTPVPIWDPVGGLHLRLRHRTEPEKNRMKKSATRIASRDGRFEGDRTRGEFRLLLRSVENK